MGTATRVGILFIFLLLLRPPASLADIWRDHLWKAQAAANQADPDTAETELKQALSRQRQSEPNPLLTAEIQLKLADLYRTDRRYSEALFYYRQALAFSVNQQNVSVYGGLIRNSDQLVNNYIGAPNTIPGSPLSARVLYGLGLLYRDQGLLDKAQALIARAVEMLEQDRGFSIYLQEAPLDPSVINKMRADLEKIKRQRGAVSGP